jgi:predicted O-methyltransferase YrrM
MPREGEGENAMCKLAGRPTTGCCSQFFLKMFLLLRRVIIRILGLRENYGLFPPGHFYSPIPSIKDIKNKEAIIWGRTPANLPGIELYEESQLELFKEFQELYKELPFGAERLADSRYFYDNPNYSYSDAIFTFCMIRKLKPKRIVEVGSGYSSCLMMDINEKFFGNQIKITCVEPYPELLYSLLLNGDRDTQLIIPQSLQDTDLGLFTSLASNDILFIDSTHVSKISSDVNYLLFQILPALSPNVYVHFHDIFYPFEYPKEWVYEGRAWNENYILRAFLQYNSSFRIVFFGSFFQHFHREEFAKYMPLCMKNLGGSIWIKKV